MSLQCRSPQINNYVGPKEYFQKLLHTDFADSYGVGDFASSTLPSDLGVGPSHHEKWQVMAASEIQP